MCLISVPGLPTVSEEECRSPHKRQSVVRRLPDISNIPTNSSNKNQSSRSFDSGICVLLSDCGSPSPPLASSSSSPVPARSPLTPSKRASFHAYSPAKLPKPPAPPNSPSLKHVKPSFFSCRRFSEHAQTGGCKVTDCSSCRTSVSPCDSQGHSPPASPTLARRKLPDTPSKQRKSGDHTWGTVADQ